jgi:hypothetical protein
MDPRFVTRNLHAYLDYPVAVSLMVLPFVLNLGSSNPLALWLAVGTGVAAFVLTLLTDHNLGAFRILPYWFHLAVDGLVGIAFLAAPALFGFSGLDAWYYWANGAAVMLVIGLHKPEAAGLTTTARA